MTKYEIKEINDRLAVDLGGWKREHTGWLEPTEPFCMYAEHPDYYHEIEDSINLIDVWKDGGEYRTVTIIWGDENTWEVRLHDSAMSCDTPYRVGHITNDCLSAAICLALNQLIVGEK